MDRYFSYLYHNFNRYRWTSSRAPDGLPFAVAKELTMQDQMHQLTSFADSFVRSRVRGMAPVSVKDAVGDIRRMFPDCVLSTRELADLIARQAVSHGYPVIFDCLSGEPEADSK